MKMSCVITMITKYLVTSMIDVSQVVCLECDKTFKDLRNHLCMHGMTIEQYQLKYGDDVEICSSLTKKKRSDARRRAMSSPEARMRASRTGRMNIMKVNASGKGWRMPKGHHTEEHKQRMREKMTGRIVTWGDKIRESHWAHNPEMRDAVNAKRLATLRSDPVAYERWCDAISAGNAKRDASTYVSSHKRGWYVSSKTGQHEYYRSSYEQVRMEELDDDCTVVFWTT